MYLSGLLSITKLQNLKAIHNTIKKDKHTTAVVINHKTTKFESNSQLFSALLIVSVCCYQSQNYKIWKQFTTGNGSKNPLQRLLSITKLQNLKAIHNTIKKDKHTTAVVINHKTTKFESNSQLMDTTIIIFFCCYQSQNYKIWKQFTTLIVVDWKNLSLLSITKLQNLKAIHNWNIALTLYIFVVINHKTTKFESNSQLIAFW